MKDEIKDLLRKLLVGGEEDVSRAAVKLNQMEARIVELPQKQVAAILQALLSALDSSRCDSDGMDDIYAALDSIIDKVTVKYKIVFPKDQAGSYEYVIGLLGREEFPG